MNCQVENGRIFSLKKGLKDIVSVLIKMWIFFIISEAEELSSRLMHTIIDIRNDESGRVILEEARKDKIVNPLDLRCIYLEEILGK